MHELLGGSRALREDHRFLDEVDLDTQRAGYDTVQLGRGELGLALDLLGDSVTVDARPYDRHVGHGMACAGIIGALGFGMPPGVGGAAQLLPMRALAGARFPGKVDPVGIGATTDLDMAVKMAVDLGAKVLNMSFRTDRYWPAAYTGVLAVGAVGADGRPTSFSTRGDHVALCAPGERIRSLGLDGYQQVTGTSFAAPFVAGAAALLVARAERRSMPIDAWLVRKLLVEPAAPFSGRSGHRLRSRRSRRGRSAQSPRRLDRSNASRRHRTRRGRLAGCPAATPMF